MTVETAIYINTLDATLPTGADPKSESDNHHRLIKSAVKATFANVTGAVTPTHTELNYVAGVTSAIQTQFTAQTNALAAKADLASPALTGVPTAPTAATGTGTTQIATTAFVVATGLSSALPGQTGNAGKFVTTNGTNASWADAFTGTAKGTVNLLTGASIAGAATINLDTATGNNLHITGSGWNCSSITLTAGSRILIIDGVGTLTHHATNNNLQGAANITTAAGDRVLYVSDGTTRYGFYFRADGTSLVNASVGSHEVTVHSGNGFGSTNTQIRRFTTALVNTGTAITYADSATLGATFTINENGLYEIYYSDTDTVTNVASFGISLNSSQLSTDLSTITNMTTRLMLIFQDLASRPKIGTRTVRLVATDVIRAHWGAINTPATNTLCHFSIRKIAS